MAMPKKFALELKKKEREAKKKATEEAKDRLR